MPRTEPEPTPESIAASVFPSTRTKKSTLVSDVLTKVTAKPKPRRAKQTLEQPSRSERLADVMVSRIANDRSGISPIFHDQCATFIAKLRSVHRDELQTAEALEAVRTFAATLGVYFEEVKRTGKN